MFSNDPARNCHGVCRMWEITSIHSPGEPFVPNPAHSANCSLLQQLHLHAFLRLLSIPDPSRQQDETLVVWVLEANGMHALSLPANLGGWESKWEYGRPRVLPHVPLILTSIFPTLSSVEASREGQGCRPQAQDPRASSPGWGIRGLTVAEGQTALSQLREIQIVILPEPLNRCQPRILHPRLSAFLCEVPGWRAPCNNLLRPQVLKFSSKNSIPKSVLYSHQKIFHVP